MTDGELAVLRMLWAHGPGTARQLHDDLVAAGMPRAFKTTQRFLEIMTAKGLIEPTGLRPRRFRPVATQERVRRRLLADLLASAFDDDPAALVETLMVVRFKADDFAAIRRVVDDRARRLADPGPSSAAWPH